MTYRPPLADIRHVIDAVIRPDPAVAPEFYDGTADAVLDEAGRFAREVLLPLDAVGDREGLAFADGKVTTAPGWRDAYRRWIDAGWGGLTAPEAYGGQGLSLLLQSACLDLWTAANPSFTLGPLLTMSAVDALLAHGSPAQKDLYLPRLVTGTWSGTMNLTEPQAGSDLGGLTTRAVPQGDGTFRLFGEKIFITYGEHDLADNIVHLVLARLPDAPAGVRGISLFLVPKFEVRPDGGLGARNDLGCAGLERKLGMHAAPTCTMRFGLDRGAVGTLVGEPGRGLNAMFTMMNRARLAIGLQGVGAAERATQHGLRYAAERRQGRRPGDPAGTSVPIVQHPDVARMGMAMRARTAAARVLCYQTAAAIDLSERAASDAERAAAAERAALLTPLAKAFATDAANEAANLDIQIHGGLGYIEASGAPQIMRDARIAAIYEGTNGIQAIDLVMRKLGLADGAALARIIADQRAALDRIRASNAPDLGSGLRRLNDAVDAVERTAPVLRERLATTPERALAAATPFLRLFALAQAGSSLAAGAFGPPDGAEASPLARATARFFAEHVVAETSALEATILDCAEDVAAWPERLLEALEA